MYLNWGTCGDDRHWCNLMWLQLPIPGNPHGVYIIWNEGPPRRVVYVGQGDVSSRLATHRTDPQIRQHERYGTLLATWASVPVAQRNSVERILADTLSPLVGAVHPARDFLVQVNLPWEQ